MKVHTVVTLALLAAGLHSTAQAAAPGSAMSVSALLSPPALELSDLECRAGVSPYTCSIAAAELELAYGRRTPVLTALGDEDLLAPPAKPAQAQREAPAPVPEPQTFVMMMLGLVLLGFASARRDLPEKFSS
ncbi:PEP-CTERM sorting domain-containing protein [Oxalobacteraceae bacterium A2-2]